MPYEDISYDRVREGRGIDKLVVAWESNLAVSSQQQRVTDDPQTSQPFASDVYEMKIQEASPIAENIILLSLKPSTSQNIPAWAAGAHIDIAVGNSG
jgi:hypothetical protein